MQRSAYEIACDLIRRLDINTELLRGKHPPTKTDMEASEQLHREWQAAQRRLSLASIPAQRSPYWDAMEIRLQAPGRDTDSVSVY